MEKTTKTTKTLPKAILNKPVVSAIDKTVTTQKKSFEKHTNTIRKEMQTVEKSFLKIGHALYSISCIYSAKEFKAIGYKNIYDYAQREFNIARGTCSDFMHIIEKFGKRDEKGCILPELSDEYKAFSSSKLSVMISMEDDVLKDVNADMTVKAIKDLKKVSKDNTKVSDEKADSEADTEIIENDDYEISNVIISFRTLEEYNSSIDKLDDLIVRCLKAGHVVRISETVPKIVRTSEQ